MVFNFDDKAHVDHLKPLSFPMVVSSLVMFGSGLLIALGGLFMERLAKCYGKRKENMISFVNLEEQQKETFKRLCIDSCQTAIENIFRNRESMNESPDKHAKELLMLINNYTKKFDNFDNSSNL